MEVQVKDTIRSYDFKPMLGRSDCFVEGVVLDRNDSTNGYQAYKIRVTRDVFDGKEFTDKLLNYIHQVIYFRKETYDQKLKEILRKK